MDHYIAYHSIELMGYEYEPTERFYFFSQKAESVLRRALGNRVWVVVGRRDGSTTTFSLAGVFTPSEVRAESDGFGIVGPGTPFRPSIDVTTRPWFRALLREQRNFSFGFNRIRSKDIVAKLGRHLEAPDGNAVTIHDTCVYAIRHGDALEEDWRHGDQFSFTERRSWARAAKELALAKQRQAVLPIVFADARATSHLIFRGQIDNIHLLSTDGKSQTTVVVSHLEKLARPPLKTQLTIADSGHRIPAGYIRSYVICRTPRWLSSEEVVSPASPPEMLDLPEPTTEGRKRLVQHLIRERNRALIERKKHAVLESTGCLACEVCGFDFRECYGSLGDGFCEVHHRLALSDTSAEVQTTLDDLAVVCANCHRMIHRGGEARELSVVRATVRHA